MSEPELGHILEALANDGFEWRLASDDDFDTEYPDDPGWKVRYVAKGYEAIYGVDYKKTTSPTMRLETFRIIAHLSAVFDSHYRSWMCGVENGCPLT
jgi:hypothetical protein